MFKRLSWYALFDILGLEFLKEHLAKETISKIRFKELRDKYEFKRKISSGEPISFTGWSNEYYQTIKHTLFSNK